MAGLTEVLLGVTVVLSGGTAYAASLRDVGFGRTAPFLAVTFAAAGWLLHTVRVPGVPHLLLVGTLALLALGFLGER